MTINRKPCGDESRVVKALVDQVSQIQEDISELGNEIDGLDQSKVSKVDLADSVTTENLTANSANIGGTTITTEQLSTNKASANDLYSPKADFEYEHANEGYIEALTTDALTVNGDETVVNLNAQRISVAGSLTVPDINTEEVSATNVTASGRVSANNVSTKTVNAGQSNVVIENVSQKLNVKDIHITGEITGLNNVDINAKSIDTPVIDADSITTGSIVTSDVNHLIPSPHLDNNDHYTIVLPVFTGTMVLKWADESGNEVWSATVIGNGSDYSIHWGTKADSITVTKLYQYRNHLYIRENANGSLYYSYHTTEEIEAPSVLYNYTELDSVITENYKYDVTVFSGTYTFGSFYASNFAAHSLTLDVSAEPRETPYVLGYDGNGKVFPAIAQGGGGGGGSVVLPKNADYIYTDVQGIPLKGVAATDLNDSDALVKASLVAPLADKINELTEVVSVLDELKPNQTVDYFNSVSPLDYRSITSFETGKTSIKNKNDYAIVADGVIGFTGLKVDNNVLHLDHTMGSFNYNKDLSYMFNGCSNFDGTGFDVIPDGTTNTAFMFADTKLKKPYKLPASVINSDNMYKNVSFEATSGENIDGISGLVFNVDDSFDINVINSNINLYRETRYVNDTSLNVINSYIGFNNRSVTNGFIFNNSNLYFEDANITTAFNAKNSNVILKGDFKRIYGGSYIHLDNCEINAVDINDWSADILNMTNGNIYIGDNTNVMGMFASSSGVYQPKVVYPYDRTNWAGLYSGAKVVNMAFVNEILLTASNVDGMFSNCLDTTLNMNNIYSVLNKDISSLYKFQEGVAATYNSLADLRAVFPNVKNIGSSNVVKSDLRITEEDVASFTDVSGILAKIPEGVTTFNVPTLTTLENTFWDGTNNVNIVISNNCTLAPNVYSRVFDRSLTGDLSGIKNGYWLYDSASQWFGYPENLETAQYMYNGALFTEIGEPIPSGLTNTAGMFENCWNITSIPGVMDLSKCNDASGMFRRCNNLTSVDFNFLKTLKPGADISYIFNGCNNLAITDFNVFSWIPEGVKSNGWFTGKLVSDINTNDNSIISVLNGLNIDGNVDIAISTNAFNIDVVNNKSLNIDIDTTTLEQNMHSHLNLGSNKYNLSLTSLPTQEVRLRLNGQNINNSYFEVNGGKYVIFDGGQYTYLNNSRFVLTDIDTVKLNGNYYYGGLFMLLTDVTININNVPNLAISVGSCTNVHINQLPTEGFILPPGVEIDSPASINVINRISLINETIFVDNRLNINVLNNTIEVYYTSGVHDIYLNSVGADGWFSGGYTNVIVHIPTNATLATGLNNGTYGDVPSENIIQY